MNKDIIEKTIKIENKFLPLKEYLENYSDYKGMINIQSKISFQPSILFLGINPGEGAFNELNQNQEKINLGEIRFPNRLLSNEKYFKSLDLDWFKENNAKYGKWFEKGKTKNTFPKQMIDILYNISENSLGRKINLAVDEDKKLFVDEIANKIVYTNICPIATKSTKELKIIYRKLAKEPDLKNYWNGTVQNFFRQRTIDLILELQPKLIVCVGSSVYKDLFLKDTSKKEKVFSSSEIIKRKDNQYKIEVVTFSRKGTWSIKKISDLVIKNER